MSISKVPTGSLSFMAKQSRSLPVMQAVLDEVCKQLMSTDESLIRIPDVCKATGVNYGSVYHHFGSREGVIDAAYNMLFSQLAEEDIQVLRDVNDSAATLDEYVAALTPLVERFSSGPDQKSVGRCAFELSPLHSRGRS